jgi:hypothetical protein
MDETIERKMHHCKRCGWDWLSPLDHPTCCARCKNPYWDKERVADKEKEAEANTGKGLTSADEE